MSYNIILIVASLLLLSYIVYQCYLVYLEQLRQLQKQNKKHNKKEQTKDKIIFSYNGDIYKYKDKQSFYKSLDQIESTKYFIKSTDEKDKIRQFIQLYYPESKIYNIEI